MKPLRHMPQLSCTVRDEDLLFINRVAMQLIKEKGRPATISEAVRHILAKARGDWTGK